MRDAASRAEIEAYRAEARGLAQRASPELLDAYQRFADGDRVGAWPVIEVLTQARTRATMAAAGARAAVSVRDAAQARETMRLYGEASAADVGLLEIARRLALADPSNPERARDVWVSLWRIARFGGGAWADVIAAMEDARGRGLFNGAHSARTPRRGAR